MGSTWRSSPVNGCCCSAPAARASRPYWPGWPGCWRRARKVPGRSRASSAWTASRPGWPGPARCGPVRPGPACCCRIRRPRPCWPGAVTTSPSGWRTTPSRWTGSGPGSRRRCRRSPSRSDPTIRPRDCLAGSGSDWRWPGCWRWRRACCCWTSRPRCSTRRPLPGCAPGWPSCWPGRAPPSCWSSTGWPSGCRWSTGWWCSNPAAGRSPTVRSRRCSPRTAPGWRRPGSGCPDPPCDPGCRRSPQGRCCCGPNA